MLDGNAELRARSSARRVSPTTAASTPRSNALHLLRFSALRRFGTPSEAASAITWMALDNEHMNGKVLTANGGI